MASWFRKRWEVSFGSCARPERYRPIVVDSFWTERGARNAARMTRAFIRMRLELEGSDERHWVSVRRGTVRYSYREVDRCG